MPANKIESDARLRVARAMAIEVSCVLGGWVDNDEDLRGLSPLSLAQIAYSRMIRVALSPELDAQALQLPHQGTEAESSTPQSDELS